MSNLQRFETYELVEELKERTAVDSLVVGPYAPYQITWKDKDGNDLGLNGSGPAIILIVTD